MRTLKLLAMVALGLALSPSHATGQPQKGKTAPQNLEDFSKAWDESTWEKTFRTTPNKYMRPLGDEGWKVRMRALQGVVGQGKEAIPTLLEALKDKDVLRRIFAAQALGYLAPDVPTEPLLEAAKNDPDAAVRLYAVDALGMKGDKTVDFDALMSAERGGDVRKHLNYAKERKGERVEAAVIKRLTDWNPATMDSAILGKLAPDFELKAATGETVKLSSYRGKSAVVLVFVYGDT